MVDHEALAVRSLDEPLSREEREALRVWGDALEWAGDPRGALIALEHAMRDQPERAHELRRAMLQHVLTSAGAQLGRFAPFAGSGRAIELDWRSGFLHSAFIDTRHLAARDRLAPDQAVALLLDAPFAATLRRLYVRVRVPGQIDPVLAALREAVQRRPLEEIIATASVWPSSITARPHRSPAAEALVAGYPGLRLMVEHSSFVSLPLAVPAAQPGRAIAHLLATAQPGTRDGRVVLGRALLHHDGEVRAAALARLVELGPRAFAFLDTLMMLLQPHTVPQAPIIACIAGLGDDARVALPLLSTIAGHPGYYDAETRRAATAAIAALAR